MTSIPFAQIRATGASIPDLGGLSRTTTLRLDTIYRENFKDLCNHMRRSFGSGPPEPEDVCQAAFARFAALEDPAQIHNPRAFLFTTARNIVLDHKRAETRHLKYAREVLVEHSTTNLDELSPERVYIHKERFDILRRAVADLPHKQQVVLKLHRISGYTYQQIATETGWSYGDVYRQMEAALATLAERLKR